MGSIRLLTEGELERLNEEFIVEYTYNSNAIEGNTLTLRETDLVLRSLTIDKKTLKDHMEAVGHKEAFDFVSELVKDNVTISKRIIKQIHYLVLANKKEDRGVIAGFQFILWVHIMNQCSRISLNLKWNSYCTILQKVKSI